MSEFTLHQDILLIIITTWLIKSSPEIICKLANLSFTETVSLVFKAAVVTPLIKKPSPEPDSPYTVQYPTPLYF